MSFLRVKGYDEDTIRLAGSMGHSSIEEANQILNRADSGEDLPELDFAFLCIHYVDGFSRGELWVEPAGVKNGELINEIDRRADKGRDNPSLKQLEQDGVDYFGMTTSEAMRVVGHRVETFLARKLSDTIGQEIDPLRLPEYIDQKLKEQIASV